MRRPSASAPILKRGPRESKLWGSTRNAADRLAIPAPIFCEDSKDQGSGWTQRRQIDRPSSTTLAPQSDQLCHNHVGVCRATPSQALGARPTKLQRLRLSEEQGPRGRSLHRVTQHDGAIGDEPSVEIGFGSKLAHPASQTLGVLPPDMRDQSTVGATRFQQRVVKPPNAPGNNSPFPLRAAVHACCQDSGPTRGCTMLPSKREAAATASTSCHKLSGSMAPLACFPRSLSSECIRADNTLPAEVIGALPSTQATPKAVT